METNLEKSNSEFDDIDDYDDNNDNDDFYAPISRSSPPKQHDVKPQAQFCPYLFVQERQQSGSRSGSLKELRKIPCRSTRQPSAAA